MRKTELAIACAVALIVGSAVAGCSSPEESARAKATQLTTDRAVEVRDAVTQALSSFARTDPSQRRLTATTRRSMTAEGAVLLSVSPPDDPQHVLFSVGATGESGGGFSYVQTDVVGCFTLDAGWQTVALEGVGCPADAKLTKGSERIDALGPLGNSSVTHAPCYGGEPADDPNCPGG